MKGAAGALVSVPTVARLPFSIPISPWVSSIWRPQRESGICAPVGGRLRLAFNPRSRQLALVFPGAIQVRDLQTDKVLWEQPICAL